MTKEYLPQQKRVMDEHEELCGRIKELEAYIAGDEFARLLYVDRIILIGVRLEKGNYPTLSAFFAQMATD
ncbi:hypothetical protein OIL03_19565 [Salmonella enterica subsp. enterica serovar Agona]|nr:hypothetical protein [Salmonella enterica subsp. enterica serovar Agona]